MRKPLIPTLAVLASASLLALTGCSAPAENTTSENTTSEKPSTSNSQAPTKQEPSAASDSAQTVEESCAVASEAMSSVQSEMSEVLTNMGSGDIAGVIPALEEFEGSLGVAVGEVSNPEVGAALDDFRAKFAAFNDILAGAESGGVASIDQTALQTAATDLQTSAQGVQELCS